jgi:hypothetical protein
LLISCKNTHFAADIPSSVVVFNDEHMNYSTESDIRRTVSHEKDSKRREHSQFKNVIFTTDSSD